MKTYQLIIPADRNENKVMQLLNGLVDENIIELQQINNYAKSANEEQVEEMIEEAALGPYYTDKEARRILNI
ncbi:hypothetical protein [Dyadobacter tibetensis]|uniref:hypothetical protein n=1 Tax=Dyadobacter tibetensis TaxID=1211851 RepID=UPI00046FDCA2|nr:hypothetical protein [Dyadobacter tibetensis]